MARQGGRVQLEQADMRIAQNVVNMAKHGISRAAIEETKNLIKKPRAEIREEKRRGVELPGHKSVKAVIEKHPSMIYENHLIGCLRCQNNIARNPATRWKRKGTKSATVIRPAISGAASSAAPSASKSQDIPDEDWRMILEAGHPHGDAPLDDEDDEDDEDDDDFTDDTTSTMSRMSSHLSYIGNCLQVFQRQRQSSR